MEETNEFPLVYATVPFQDANTAETVTGGITDEFGKFEVANSTGRLQHQSSIHFIQTQQAAIEKMQQRLTALEQQ